MKRLFAVFVIALALILARHVVTERCREAGKVDLSQVNVRVFTETLRTSGFT